MWAVMFFVGLVLHPGLCRSVEEDSVVSVYTTQPTTAGTAGLDVYHQIANNIAERITSPIYKFLGITRNNTDDKPSTPAWENLELLDDLPEEVTEAILHSVDNNIDEKESGELSIEAKRRNDQKPEKITLLDDKRNDTINDKRNDTINEVSDDDDDDEPFEFDDGEEKPREGGFVYFLELIGSFIQLAFGAIMSLFKPNSS